MKVKESTTWKQIISKDGTFKTSDGSPDLPSDTVEVYAQQIHDLLTGKGFTFMNCFLILHIVQDTLMQERDIKKL